MEHQRSITPVRTGGTEDHGERGSHRQERLLTFGRSGRSFPTPYRFGDRWSSAELPIKLMNRTPLSSSNLRSVGYDTASATLEVEFRHGGVYQYFDVPGSQYAALLSAHSHGSYFGTFIKAGGFAYAKIE
jgi:hypothetical protein